MDFIEFTVHVIRFDRRHRSTQQFGHVSPQRQKRFAVLAPRRMNQYQNIRPGVESLGVDMEI